MLSSNKKAKITLNKNVITKDEIDSLTLEINPASLIRYLFFEHIDNQMEKETWLKHCGLVAESAQDLSCEFETAGTNH